MCPAFEGRTKGSFVERYELPNAVNIIVYITVASDDGLECEVPHVLRCYDH